MVEIKNIWDLLELYKSQKENNIPKKYKKSNKILNLKNKDYIRTQAQIKNNIIKYFVKNPNEIGIRNIKNIISYEKIIIGKKEKTTVDLNINDIDDWKYYLNVKLFDNEYNRQKGELQKRKIFNYCNYNKLRNCYVGFIYPKKELDLEKILYNTELYINNMILELEKYIPKKKLKHVRYNNYRLL